MDGWTLGFAIGLVVVAAVVVLLVLMIAYARRLNAEAEGILAALRDARDHTRGLWELPATNAAAERIVAGASAARRELDGQEGGR